MARFILENDKFICDNCKKTIKYIDNNNYNYCPYCGNPIEKLSISKKDWNLDGKVHVDFIKFMEERGFG